MADRAGERKNVVIVSTSRWDSDLWFRRQHFAHRFALSGWKVLYVNPSFTLFRPMRKKSEVPLSRLGEFLKDYDAETNLRVITPPPLLPLEHRYQQITKFNKRGLGRYIEAKARRFFGAEPYVVIYYSPFDVYLDIKNACLTIYECVDEWSGYPDGIEIRRRIEKAEELLIRKADAVTVTADSLKKSKSKWRQDIVCLPNGVATSVFLTRDTLKVPNDIADLQYPIIIYVGAIHEWFNLALVEKICSRRTAWNLLLIGPEKVLSSRVLPPNLRYLGTKNWTALPAYLKAADLAIIPFEENSLTVNINPLKLYEYFAAGLSCVSSFMYEIEKYKEPYVLEIARNDEDFINAIERNIDKKEEKMAKKLSIAKSHSWDNIFNEFENLILSSKANKSFS